MSVLRSTHLEFTVHIGNATLLCLYNHHRSSDDRFPLFIDHRTGYFTFLLHFPGSSSCMDAGKQHQQYT